jgi:RNA polymerase sigma factor (sigma-70 family)
VRWDEQGPILFPIIFPVARVPTVRDNEAAVAAQEQEAGVAPLMDTEKQRLTSSAPDFEALVEQHYRRMYQFAYNLTQDEAEAYDLTQQTFLKWARKGHQLRDPSKVKTWLFTTLHREFLQARRNDARFPHHELDKVERELPAILPTTVDQLDAATVVASLAQVSERFRAPLALFYLDDHSYKEIAEILDVPVGTVQSRIARGKSQLYKILTDNSPSPITGAEKPHG